MTNWLDSAQSLLQKKDYQGIIDIYENLIENDPEDINNYWYLGLAYLLNDQEEEAKTTWFIPFWELEEQETTIAEKQLVAILSQEALKQFEQQKYDLAWQIRQQIIEISPNDINNLLSLLNISFLINTFTLENLNQWNITSVINNDLSQNIDSNLALKVIEKIIFYPYQEILVLIKTLLNHQKGNEEVINLISQKSETIAYDQKYFLYSAKLIEVCLQHQPHNLNILKQAFWYNILAQEYKQAQKIAEQFSQNSINLPQQILGKYFQLYLMLNKGDWHDVLNTVTQYEQLIKKLDKDEIISEQYIIDSLILLSQPLLYIQDKPEHNRAIINKIADIFQNITEKKYNINQTFNNNKKSSQKLKIAYIGHTFKKHSVGWLCRWLMKYHDKEKFTIYNYLLNQEEDELTLGWFKTRVDKAIHLPNDINAIVRQIQEDEINILVDLDSFTLNITQLVMALKTAPIQVSWLGMDSTGLSNIDYFMADPYVLPNQAQKYYQETIWRLPHTYLAVDGFEKDVPNLNRKILNIPHDAIIYFNTQNAFKRHPDTIHLQMKIIKSVPNSYLLIKGSGDQDIVKQMFITIAQQEGVHPDRLRFLDKTPTEALHRANLAIADIVLDTYPYNGATTTLETLWMEIPLVTRVGEQFAARNSYTFMMNAGITEGIAWSDEEYIEWGIKFGTDENLRKEVSWKLRQSKKTSPLWDAKQFTRDMEKAYQQMWEIYINSEE